MNKAATTETTRETTYAEDQARLARVLDAMTKLSDTPPTPAEQRMEVEYYDSKANT